MFGLLRPSDRGLRCSQRQEFHRFYCGLCKGLDHHHGTVSRGLLSYDGVFVALVVDALVETPAPPSSCRCPLLPVVHRKTVAPDSVAMTYAASVQMLLFDQWAADGGRSLVRRFSLPHAELAHARLGALGANLRALEGFDRVQSRVEREDATAIAAAAPTAEALRLVFASIASLPGAAKDLSVDVLGELGAAIGRTIYFVDALEDLEDDLRKGAFNPCLAGGRRDDRRVREVTRLLRGNAEGLAPLLDALPLARHQHVLRDILGELRARATRAATATRTLAERPGSRLRALVIAMAVFVWALLCAVPRAFAAAPKRDAGGPDAGLTDAGPPHGPGSRFSPELDAGLPELPPPASSTSDKTREDKASDGKSAPASSSSSKEGSKPGSAKACDACPDCGNPCRTCGESCGDTCKPCRECGACCDKPDTCCDRCCSGCCKPCDGCKGCDGCGSCCNDCGKCCK